MAAMRSHRWIVGVGIVCAGVGLAAQAPQPANKAKSAPTAADWAAIANLPDFTGVWEIPMGGGGRGARGAGAGRGVPARPSLTPEYAAKKRAYDERAAEDTDAANCLPPGMPGIMGQPYPMEFLLTPGQVTIVIEAYQQVRHIYTDGRPLPDDPDPAWYGYSIGKWEGDTFVVETAGFKEGSWLDNSGHPHTEALQLTERYRRINFGRLELVVTVNDPKAYSRPWTSDTLRFNLQPDTELLEHLCENNKDLEHLQEIWQGKDAKP